MCCKCDYIYRSFFLSDDDDDDGDGQVKLRKKRKLESWIMWTKKEQRKGHCKLVGWLPSMPLS